MGWEQRARGGQYYTRSQRVNGRVVREYVGAGLVAQLVAQRDAEERAERRKQAASRRAERDRLEEADRQLIELCEITEALVRGALLRAGYRRHDRGEWRKQRAQEERAGA